MFSGILIWNEGSGLIAAAFILVTSTEEQHHRPFGPTALRSDFPVDVQSPGEIVWFEERIAVIDIRVHERLQIMRMGGDD
jgi:hypothetical protein